MSHLKLKNPQTKANLVKRTPEEESKRKTSAFSYNEVYYESCSSADSNDPRIRMVLCVHEEGKHDAHDCAPDEDQVQKACLVSGGVTRVAYGVYVGTAKVDWNLVKSQCNLDQTRRQEAERHKLVPSSYFKDGTGITGQASSSRLR